MTKLAAATADVRIELNFPALATTMLSGTGGLASHAFPTAGRSSGATGAFLLGNPQTADLRQACIIGNQASCVESVRFPAFQFTTKSSETGCARQAASTPS